MPVLQLSELLRENQQGEKYYKRPYYSRPRFLLVKLLLEKRPRDLFIYDSFLCNTSKIGGHPSVCGNKPTLKQIITHYVVKINSW